LRDGPFLRRRNRDGFLDPFRRAQPPLQRRRPRRRLLLAHRCERYIEQVEADGLDLEIVDIVLTQSRAQHVPKHHGRSRQQPVGCERGITAPVELFRREFVAKPQDQRAIADAARIADPVGRVGGDVHGMAGRADHLPPRRVMLGEHAGQWQHNRVAILSLDVTAGIRNPAGLEQADLQGRALEHGLTGDVQGKIHVS
jgi:hypothetical protein